VPIIALRKQDPREFASQIEDARTGARGLRPKGALRKDTKKFLDADCAGFAVFQTRTYTGLTLFFVIPAKAGIHFLPLKFIRLWRKGRGLGRIGKK